MAMMEFYLQGLSYRKVWCLVLHFNVFGIINVN